MKAKVIKKTLIFDKVLDETIGKVKTAGGFKNPDVTLVLTGLCHKNCHHHCP